MSSKENLIKDLIDRGFLKTPRIIMAFEKIDRADFIPEALRDVAYLNEPLPIGHNQTISQPLTVAFMLELLFPARGDKILDIGAGSGWQTSLLAHIVGEKGKIIAVERILPLKAQAEENINKYNFVKEGRVKITWANASSGYPEEAPYNGIIAAASGEEIPNEWKDQLKIGGRIVAPVKNSIVVIDKISAIEFREREYEGFNFVPLITD